MKEKEPIDGKRFLWTRSLQGLTLLEMIMVLFIIGMSAMIVAPNWGGLMSSWALEKEARGLVQDINRAQQLAKSEMTAYGIAFDPANDCYDIGSDSGTGFTILETVCLDNDLDGTWNWTSSTSTCTAARTVCFNHFGAAAVTTDVNVQIQDVSGRTFWVRINSVTGRVRVEES